MTPEKDSEEFCIAMGRFYDRNPRKERPLEIEIGQIWQDRDPVAGVNPHDYYLVMSRDIIPELATLGDRTRYWRVARFTDYGDRHGFGGAPIKDLTSTELREFTLVGNIRDIIEGRTP